MLAQQPAVAHQILAVAPEDDLLGQQTRLLGFMDCFRIMGILTIAMIPAVFFIRRFKVGGKAPAGH